MTQNAPSPALSGALDTPIGPIVITAHADRPETLVALHLWDTPPVVHAPAGKPERLIGLLDRYFQGEVAILDSIAVAPRGTPFQLRVWEELRRIPAGTTISYGELARRVGQPAAVRAVARANGANPIAIVVPCHRVIAADGSLHGYGGGLERKDWLLRHEARWTKTGLFAST